MKQDLIKASELDDADEFNRSVEQGDSDADDGKFVKPNGNVTASLQEVIDQINGEEGRKPKPGQVSQYSLHGQGYMPTTSTIKTLPSGCYDLMADRNGVYAVPMSPPSGLLLELPEMRSEYVLDLIDTFWKSEADYKQGNEYVSGGAQFKAGIMLFGPQGSGKSCSIKLATKKAIERGATVFYSQISPLYTNIFLTDFSKIEKDRKTIVVLEDIDTLIENYGQSGYLAMLDSAQSIENVLFIATTNYPERLEPRIYNRPGRFSHIVKVGLPGVAARRAFLKAVLKKHDDVEEIVAKSEGFSVDHLSSLINAVYREKKKLGSEIERLRKLFKVPAVIDTKQIGLIGE